MSFLVDSSVITLYDHIHFEKFIMIFLKQYILEEEVILLINFYREMKEKKC